MKYSLIVLFICAATLHAGEDILLQRIVALEKHVAELEEKLAPVFEEERIKDVATQQKNLARERMLMDAEFLSRLDLNLVEKAYHTANQDWKAEEARKAVALLSERYPRANRTGCAVLNLAQSTADEEQLELLGQAIGKHNGCFYANGVQVGAYARLYLGMRHKKDGKDEEAATLFEEIRTTYPNAIDHKGQLLTSHLEGMEL
ncbi:MAG: hypothetical protein U9P12_09015 [Verrucomicrobiota bacterium]|nr:hypothetical protein [Verrucomicrobiota bacterium]